MRLRQRDLKPYVYKEWQKVKERDGTTYDGWGNGGVIYANIQPVSGKRVVEMYGARAAYMLVAYLEDIHTLEEGDGVYYGIEAAANVDPNYKIVAIRPWNNHFVMDLEKRVVT